MLKKNKSICRTAFSTWTWTIILLSLAFVALLVYQRVSIYKTTTLQCLRLDHEVKLNILQGTVSNVISFIEANKSCVNDENEDLENKLLSEIKKISFGARSKVMVSIVKDNGEILLAPFNKLLEGTNVSEQPEDDTSVAKFRFFIKNSTRAGARAVYRENQNKGSFAYGEYLNNPGWIICAEYYDNATALPLRAINVGGLKIDLATDIALIIVVSLFFIFVAILCSNSLAKEIKKELDAIVQFFKDFADRNNWSLDEDKISYEEFHFIAVSAKNMASQIDYLIETVKNMALEAELANQSRHNFLLSLNHEIRTPMTGITGMTELLLETQLDNTQKEYVSTIADSGHRLMKYVEQINQFTLIDDASFEIKPAPIKIKDTLDSVSEIFRGLANEKGISFENEFSDLPEWILADEKRLTQIFSGLLANAVRFTEKGKVKFLARSYENDGKAHITFTVSDEGPGISPENLKKIFDFTSKHAMLSKKFGSASLVLAVCKFIASKMEGKIEVESRKGEGTSFTVEIPFSIPSKDQIPRSETKILPITEKRERDSFKGLKVLLAEDDALNRKMAVLFLEKLGVSVSTANNGKEAVEKFKQADFDVIFMDCEMPVMDGYEASLEIKKLPKGEKIPIIAVTANALEGDKKVCLECGMNDHVPKPFTLTTLKKVLSEHCRV